MVRKKILPGIIGMVMVFGMTVVGCDNGSIDDSTNNALNGTWVDEVGSELKFNNGNLEVSDRGNPLEKNTYTTSGNSITITLTHVYGGLMQESRWYTKDEIKVSLDLSDDDLNEMFAPQTGTYSISGNTLTLDIGVYSGRTWTRK